MKQPDSDPISLERLCRMARSGKTVRDLLDELRLESPEALKAAIDREMGRKERDTAVRVVGDHLSFYPCLTDRGLRITPTLLEGTGFRTGDEFFLLVNRGRITLEKIGRPAAGGKR